ncbi:venom metalloproteinase BumaMPs1-like isoform X1 [Ornithodoros turicata]|uniref:venom metalloproteinase BumaMPs1-like isoform X1 n=1 Tax=Ornithodoros turicata TaxID=34597 RepID=UPI003138E1DE
MSLLRGVSVWVLIAPLVALHRLQSQEAIVYPEFLEERSDNGARTLKIKDDLTLNLVPKSPFPERLHLRTPRHDGSVFNTYVSSSLYSSKLFQDEDNFASLVVTEDNGLRLHGMIGDDLRIEPLATAGRSSVGHVAHRLYKVEEVRSDTPIYQYVSAPATDRAARTIDNIVESRLDKSSVRAETHIVVDSVLFAQFKKNKTDTILYMGAALNSINLRYKTVKTLEVEIVGVGFTFYENGYEEGLFLKFFNEPDAKWDEYADIKSTLAAFNDFYKKTHTNVFSNVDLLSFVTGRDMCLLEDDEVSRAVEGMAYVTGVCGDARTSVVEDEAWSFDVVRRMAHELAHNLGCLHDGEEPLKYPHGHPGAKECPWNDGYLMSFITEDNRQFQFSPCCAKQILFVSEIMSPDASSKAERVPLSHQPAWGRCFVPLSAGTIPMWQIDAFKQGGPVPAHIFPRSSQWNIVICLLANHPFCIHLRLDDKLCLFYNNSEKRDRIKSGALPGDRLSLDRLCRDAFADVTDYTFMFDNETGLSGNGCQIPCISNKVTVGRRTYWNDGQAKGLDGSRCDSNDRRKLCIRGECVVHTRCKDCHNRPSQPRTPRTTTALPRLSYWNRQGKY